MALVYRTLHVGGHRVRGHPGKGALPAHPRLRNCCPARHRCAHSMQLSSLNFPRSVSLPLLCSKAGLRDWGKPPCKAAVPVCNLPRPSGRRMMAESRLEPSTSHPGVATQGQVGKLPMTVGINLVLKGRKNQVFGRMPEKSLHHQPNANRKKCSSQSTR